MLQRSVYNHCQHLTTSSDIRKKNIGYHKRYNEKDPPFESFFTNFFGTPLLLVYSYLRAPVSLDPLLDPAKNHFHKDSLRTNPPTNNPTKSHCKQCNEYHTNNHCHHHYIEILRPECKSKNGKFPFQHIE